MTATDDDVARGQAILAEFEARFPHLTRTSTDDRFRSAVELTAFVLSGTADAPR